ncbi:peptide ABC transporter substrate-binding protein [uncultured Aureimonas sp.]|uniref:peptide ABC transporter substrate-binding protein n=1 Tax=uncultured Aureimonas sp. TaxID=1604662 RepID=UPI0025E08F1B|nr:peptide ABC transporter substrate-binding protein [uncultured Aureimonas sp.]
MTLRPIRVLFGAALLTSTLLAGSALAQTLHRGNAGEPQTLDQARTSVNIEAFVLKDLYEGLTIYDPNGKIVPGAAESWQVSDDGTVYTFKIRDAAKWSNGDPVTAGDFVFSMRRIQDPKTAAPYANILYPIKNAEKANKGEVPLDQLGVRAVDDKTLEITLERPTPFFIELLAHQTGLPVHPATVEAQGDNFVRPGVMVSNGAFKLTEQVTNDHITVTKNPDYWDAANVKLNEVIFYPIDDAAAAQRRFQAGEIDMTFDFAADQLEFLKKEFGNQVRVTPKLSTEYYAFDTRTAPFNDVNVRNALSMAIDRDFLSKEIFQGARLPALSFVPPGIPGYETPSEPTYASMDQLDREDEALRLLKDAGYGKGGKPLDISIRYNTNTNHERVATAIADMWRTQFGANVTLQNSDVASHYAYLQEGGTFNVARAGWVADYADAENFLALTTTGNKTFNYSKWSNPEYDRLMAASYEEKDPAKRAEILHQAETLILKEQPIVPLLNSASLWLVSDKVSGWGDNVADEHLSKYLSVNR